MIRRLARLPAPVVAVAGCDVHLAADDRLDAPQARRVVEGDGGKEIAMLGHRHRRHLQLGHAVEHLADPAGAIEEGELGVQVEVNEIGHRLQAYPVPAPTPTRSWMVVSS